jgi:hypothetical protein
VRDGTVIDGTIRINSPRFLSGRGRGVHFEEYDYTVGGVAAAGPHVSAWFKDSEGNFIGLMQTG